MRVSRLTLLCGLLLLPRAEAQLLQGGRLVVAGEGDDTLRVFGPGGSALGQLQAGAVADPTDLAFGPDGRLYVASANTNSVVVFDASGAKADEFPIAGTPSLKALAFGPDGQLWVLDDAANQLLRFDVGGNPRGTVDVPAGVHAESCLAFGPNGHVFLANSSDHAVQELDSASGALVRTLGAADLSGVQSLALGPDGRIWVSEATDVQVLDQDGALLDTVHDAGFNDLRSLALGPDGKLYMADDGGDVVHVIKDGAVAGALGGATLSAPTALAFVPWRLQATIKGRVARAGSPIGKVKELSAVLSLLPGSRTLMVALTDDVTKDDDLASLFGADFLVLQGFEGTEGDTSKVRLFEGAQIGAPATQSGTASMVLQVGGHMGAGQFVPKKAAGTLHRAGAAGVYEATVKTGKSLN
jgi:hypothetical protein